MTSQSRRFSRHSRVSRKAAPAPTQDLATASSTAPASDAADERIIYIDRRVVTVRHGRIDVHPARSIIFLPLLTLALGIAIFPAVFFWGDSLSLGLRLLLTFAAIVLIPISGMGLVYSIAGAHMVIDQTKKSAVLQQGFLGMGVGTQELIPFFKIDKVLVDELTTVDEQDFAQFEVALLKISGKHVPVGTITVTRAEEAEGLGRARELASLIAEMSATAVSVTTSGKVANTGPAS